MSLRDAFAGIATLLMEPVAVRDPIANLIRSGSGLKTGSINIRNEDYVQEKEWAEC